MAPRSGTCQAKNCRGTAAIRLRLSDGDVLTARTVIIATGVAYQRLGIPALADLGLGAPMAPRQQAPAMRGRSVFVVGGGSCYRCAAPGWMAWCDHPGGPSRRLHTDSHPPDRRAPERRPLPRAGRGGTGNCTGQLQSLYWEHRLRGAGQCDRLLFVLIGAQPRTEGLGEAVARDRWGFIRTGPDLPASAHARWPPASPPLPLETSLPGVFAAGDVRRGSVKRVASAVGEGAATIPLIHRHLARAAAVRKTLTGQHTRRESPPAHDRDSASGPGTLPTPTAPCSPSPHDRSPKMQQIITGVAAQRTPFHARPATAADVMRPPLTTVTQYDHVAAAAYLMKHAGTTALLVLDAQTGQPAGIITETDIAHAIADGKDVNDVRVNAVITTRPAITTTTIRDAATIMTARHHRHLPVNGDAGLPAVVDITGGVPLELWRLL
jgi:CBS domain-containing protein